VRTAPGMERRSGEDSAGNGAAAGTARTTRIRRGRGGPAAGNEAAARP